MAKEPIWSGDMRKAPGRYYIALNPAPAQYWTEHVYCLMGYEKDGAVLSDEVCLSADEWFALDDSGNFLAGTIMTKRSA